MILIIMKVNQQQSDLLTSDAPPPKYTKDNPSGRYKITDDVVVMVIVLSMLVYSIFYLTYGLSSNINEKDSQKHFQFLQMDDQQSGSLEKNSGLSKKLTWFSFEDLNQAKIVETISRKEFESKSNPFTIQDKKEKQKQKQKLKETQLQFFHEKSKIGELECTKHVIYNLGDSSIAADIEELNHRQQFIYNLRYHFKDYQKELPICMVVYSRDYRSIYYEYEPLLRSILNQKYSNFRVVFIADALDPSTLLSIYKFIRKQHYEKKIQVVEHGVKLGFVKAILKALRNNCKYAQVAALINGNDQLITQYVFAIYNAVYQNKRSKVAYGNYYEYLPLQKQIFMGSSNSYTKQEIQTLSYRQTMPKVGPLLTFNLSLVPYIDQSYLRYDQNIYYEWEDLSFKALAYQLLELSCGKIEYVFECQYLMSSTRAGLQKKEFVRQIHMEPRRCYEYEDIQ